MADKKANDRTATPDMKKASALDKVASKILQSVDPSYNDQKFMSGQNSQFNRIIDRQLDIAKGVAGNQIVDFIASLRRSQQNGPGRPPKTNVGLDTADLFTDNIGDIFGYFQDVYKNRYMEISDLKFISKFIPSIGESVRIYLDAIIASDDVSQTITRNIITPGVTDQAMQNNVIGKIEQIEREYQILQKLKVAYKKTLVSGSFFVYHIPYKQLFEMYQTGLASGQILRNAPADHPEQQTRGLKNPNGRMPKPEKANVLGIAQEQASVVNDLAAEPALEAFGDGAKYCSDKKLIYKCNLHTAAMESAMDSIRDMVEKDTLPFDRDGNRIDHGKYCDELIEGMESELPNIYFVDSAIPFAAISETSDIVEGVNSGLESYADFFNSKNDIKKEAEKLADVAGAGDGTHDINGGSTHASGQRFNNVTGTYLKWIDYKYIMPIEVLNHVVGYYHIITTPKTRKKGVASKIGNNNKSNEIGGILSSGSMSLFDQLDVSERRKESAIQNIVDTISDAILDQFGTKFVRKNAAFKSMIAECIIANGIVNNDYMIQFIPADQIIRFNCNADENGNGESILSEALFPAHLLLSIVISKMLNYINKGGNRTIAHISSGRVNRNLGNQVNRVIRDLQASNVTFTDLLSSSMVFSKVTRDSNIAMPKDQSGNRLVEFEVQEGQQIELNTDYEQMLERWCMTAVGIPPSVMDYESNVDVAKKVVSDNIRVAGRVASLQTDLEGPSTELYRALVEDSDMDEETKNLLTNLSFKLPRPRILANQNNSEALNTAFNNAQTIANIKLGDNDETDDDRKLRVKLIEKVSRKETPFIDWSEIDEMVNQSKAEISADATNDAAQKAIDGEGGDDAGAAGGDDFGGGGF